MGSITVGIIDWSARKAICDTFPVLTGTEKNKDDHLSRKMKVKLPADAAIDAEIDLCNSGDIYFLQVRLNVSLPGLEREVAQAIVDATHGETCAYSNATRGNIDVTVNVL